MAHSALLSKSIIAGLAFALAANFPNLSWVNSSRCELVDVKAVYLPAWSVAAKVKLTTDAEDELNVETNGSFFPGTSFSPLSQMILGPTLFDLPSGIPKYKPSRDLDQNSTPVTPIPFDTSPLILPSLLRDSLPIPLSSVDLEDSITAQPEWTQLDCTPLYLPLYVARFKNEKRGQDFTIVLEAASNNLGNYALHYPATDPIVNMSTPRHVARPLTQMVYRHKKLQPPVPSWLVPALALNVTSPTLDTAPTSGPHGYRDSMSSKLSAAIEAWVEKAGGREVLRERSIGAVEAEMGSEWEGKIAEWEKPEKGNYDKVIEEGK